MQKKRINLYIQGAYTLYIKTLGIKVQNRIYSVLLKVFTVFPAIIARVTTLSACPRAICRLKKV